MAIYIILVLLIAASAFIFFQNRNRSLPDPDPTRERTLDRSRECLDKLAARRSIISDLQTRHSKCRFDIINLQTGINNPPPPPPLSYYGVRETEKCDDKLAEMKTMIKRLDTEMAQCDDVRKDKIIELRKVIEKHGKITDAEFKLVLQAFDIHIH